MHVRYIFIAVLMTAVGAVVPQAAAADYTRTTFECRGDRGSGQIDGAGRLYLPCLHRGGVERPNIHVYDATGVRIGQYDVDFGDATRDQLSDIAPSPDGSFLYVMRHATKTAHRFTRQADGSYTFDPAWKLAKFPYAGGTYDPLGEFIATDALGFIYVNSGTWSNSPQTVVKYSPTGAFVTRFGDAEQSWDGGKFYWLLTGLSVTADGASVYTTEVGNNRVQRFDRQLDGSYRWGLIFGAGPQDDNPLTAYNEARGGFCWTGGKFAAPYDIAIDPVGKVYVTNTSCMLGDGRFEVQVLSRDGASLHVLQVQSQYFDRVHGIAVDNVGNIYLAQAGVILRSATPPVVPPADVTAPLLRALTLPAEVAAPQVDLAIDAIDAVGVTQMRIANEGQALATQAWLPFVTPTPHLLTAAAGAKTVTVQVRDLAGNLSTPLTATTNLVLPVVPPPVVPPPLPPPPPDPDPVPVPVPVVNTAPVLRQVTLPSPATTQTIAVVIDAIDDQGVAFMRFATESGVWQPWQPFSTPAQFTLSPGGIGLLKGVNVQVRDAQGLDSAVLYRKTIYQPLAEPLPLPNPVPVPVPVPVPGVNAAPVVTAVRMPNPTLTRLVTMQIDATDDVGVVQMRLANEDGAWSAWKPFSATTQQLLTAKPNMKKGVSVQVRDASMVESNIFYKTTLCKPCT